MVDIENDFEDAERETQGDPVMHTHTCTCIHMSSRICVYRYPMRVCACARARTHTHTHTHTHKHSLPPYLHLPSAGISGHLTRMVDPVARS